MLSTACGKPVCIVTIVKRHARSGRPRYPQDINIVDKVMHNNGVLPVDIDVTKDTKTKLDILDIGGQNCQTPPIE